MLTRAVGPTKQTRAGFLVDRGRFALVTDFVMKNSYAGPPNYELLRADVTMETKDGTVRTATGTPRQWLPLRHCQPGPDGEEAILRIVKSPTDWRFAGGRAAVVPPCSGSGQRIGAPDRKNACLADSRRARTSKGDANKPHDGLGSRAADSISSRRSFRSAG